MNGSYLKTNFNNNTLLDSNEVDIQLATQGIKSGNYFLRVVVDTKMECQYYVGDVQYMLSDMLKKENIQTLDYTEKLIINDYALSQNYPNPFIPSTQISYQIPAAGFVSLKVYDITGCEVKTLVSKAQSMGKYEVNFDASSLSSGVYFYKLTSGGFAKSMKMLLIK